jgi:copper chaperone CopZ
MRTSIIVQNLKCGGCANTITTKLSQLENVTNIVVDTESSTVSFVAISSDDALTVKERLKTLGYPSIEDGTVKFYAPITTNSMCLQCHGSPEKDIESKVLTALTNLYPEDKAIGYDVNEVRGIWSITYKQ